MKALLILAASLCADEPHSKLYERLQKLELQQEEIEVAPTSDDGIQEGESETVEVAPIAIDREDSQLNRVLKRAAPVREETAPPEGFAFETIK